MTTVKVYRRFKTKAEIGPPGAYEIDQEVVIPEHDHYGEHRPERKAVVTHIDGEGVAYATYKDDDES